MIKDYVTDQAKFAQQLFAAMSPGAIFIAFDSWMDGLILWWDIHGTQLGVFKTSPPKRSIMKVWHKPWPHTQQLIRQPALLAGAWPALYARGISTAHQHTPTQSQPPSLSHPREQEPAVSAAADSKSISDGSSSSSSSSSSSNSSSSSSSSHSHRPAQPAAGAGADEVLADRLGGLSLQERVQQSSHSSEIK